MMLPGELFGLVQEWLFERLMQPAMFALGLGNLLEEGYRATGWLLVGLLQVAVIAKRPHGFFITHVEGAQFPIVNGESLDAQAHQLKDHDVIEIAGIKMEFFLKA